MEQLVPVLLGHAHDLGDRLEWELRGDVDEEVAGAAGGQRGVDDRDGPRGQNGWSGRSPLGVKPRLTSPRMRVCTGGSHMFQHHAGADPAGQVLDDRAAAASRPGRS